VAKTTTKQGVNNTKSRIENKQKLLQEELDEMKKLSTKRPPEIVTNKHQAI